MWTDLDWLAAIRTDLEQFGVICIDFGLIWTDLARFGQISLEILKTIKLAGGELVGLLSAFHTVQVNSDC